MAGSIAAAAIGTAAGRDRAGIGGRPAARSRPARPSACSLPGPRRPTRAPLPRRDCAGTTPTRAIVTASGTPASELVNGGVGWPPAGLLGDLPLVERRPPQNLDASPDFCP